MAPLAEAVISAALVAGVAASGISTAAVLVAAALGIGMVPAIEADTQAICMGRRVDMTIAHVGDGIPTRCSGYGSATNEAP